MINKKRSLLSKFVSDFLGQHFTPWNLDTFSADHTKLFFKKLETLLSKDELLSYQKEIIQDISTFFNKLGKIKVDLVPFISIRITTEITKSRVHTYKLLKQYKPHFELLEGSNLLIINEEVTQKILDTTKSDYDSFREDIRASLAYVADIGDRYAILFGKSRIVVRTRLGEVANEKRYLGLPPEELEEIIKRHFKNLNEEIPPLMQECIETNFDFQNIANEEFETTHIKILQKSLIKILKSKSNQDAEVIKALANYILRQQFDTLHMMLANKLLESVLSKHRKAEQFLTFYTQGLISIRGEKFQIPQLEDSEGTIWSFANITHIALQYQKFLQNIDKKGSFIDKMGDTLDNIDAEISQAQQNIKTIEIGEANNLASLRETAKHITTIRKTFQSEGGSLTMEKREDLQEKVKLLEKQEREQMLLQKQHEQALSLAKKAFSDLKYKKSTTLERHDSEIDNFEDIQESQSEIIEKYKLMLTAVAKALSGKKVKI